MCPTIKKKTIFSQNNIGLIVTALMNLLSNIHNLNELALKNLVVERFEANRLLDRLSVALSTKIKRLTLVNLTENHCSLPQIAMFSNLEVGLSHLYHLICVPKDFADRFMHQFIVLLGRFFEYHRNTLTI